jgi:hypothetical protein
MAHDWFYFISFCESPSTALCRSFTAQASVPFDQEQLLNVRRTAYDNPNDAVARRGIALLAIVDRALACCCVGVSA